MAVKKPVEGPKAKLMKLSVATLRKKAKALNLADYTKKTKEKLVVSIMLAEARKKGAAARKRKPAVAKQSVMRFKRTGEQTGKSDSVRDSLRKAAAPGKRLSRTGKVYYERRRNRSDVPPTMMGAKTPDMYIDELAYLIYKGYFVDDANTDFYDAFHEVIDSMVTYYSDSIDIINDLKYFNWEDNDMGIQPTNISQVAYLALNDLAGDVESKLNKKYL